MTEKEGGCGGSERSLLNGLRAWTDGRADKEIWMRGGSRVACALVLGGARSGKTQCAERLAARWAADNGCGVTYVATGQALDAEMAARINRHRATRPAHWTTVEEPLAVAEWLSKHPQGDVVLVDCLTMLVNNWMTQEGLDDMQLQTRAAALAAAAAARPAPTVLVSGEVGLGVVPADAWTRRFCDALGWLNQAVAAVAEPVLWVVAGMAVDLRQWRVPL
ncbi:MAG: bifunctional adenosylcobinamide kinase/adenosylcobinamide-phosphate guanylyltransferase [Alicyclobacillus sp.]|nr:bifunctional adenosylcobinamide kinase/adenosylcobinamide-phosphate guanylyltransferase [Alicyclobacillus sp.]